jgi:crotonobetainyl-CoA:carnitine CoA-transferase CaiB-like acyl-CoA transferase
MLADKGADVIKVEKIPGGDDQRRAVPPSIGDESAAFTMVNRSKRGIAINLKTQGGKRVLQQILRRADISWRIIGSGGWSEWASATTS